MIEDIINLVSNVATPVLMIILISWFIKYYLDNLKSVMDNQIEQTQEMRTDIATMTEHIDTLVNYLMNRE